MRPKGRGPPRDASAAVLRASGMSHRRGGLVDSFVADGFGSGLPGALENDSRFVCSCPSVTGLSPELFGLMCGIKKEARVWLHTDNVPAKTRSLLTREEFRERVISAPFTDLRQFLIQAEHPGFGGRLKCTPGYV